MNQRLRETENSRHGDTETRGRGDLSFPASPRLRISASLFFSPFLLSVLLALPACSAFTSDVPPAADSTMVEVLVELHLADARQHLRRDAGPALRAEILERHGLDEETFEAMMAHYADHPETYIEVYDAVLDRLSAERAQTYGAPTDPESAPDLPPQSPFDSLEE